MTRSVVAALLAFMAAPLSAQSFHTLSSARQPRGERELNLDVEFVAGRFHLTRDGTGALYRSRMSYNEERFRPAYGRHEIVYKRQCVFAGTTNQSAYLKDETGNRRFWPVTVNKIEIDALRCDRDQLWAEALHRFQNGEHWWLEDQALQQLAAAQQDNRYDEDVVWEDKLRDYLENKDKVTLGQLLRDALDIPIQYQSRTEQNRVIRILNHLGWRRLDRRVDNQRVWRKGA